MADNSSYSTGCLNKDLPTEHKRLQMQERMLDPRTIRILEGLPIAPTWRCLEIGAGAGSIAYWLAARCRSGRVVATDVDTRYLDESRSDVLSVTRVDIGNAVYPDESFDLIHVRMVLCHLENREQILASIVRWLAPGGYLLVEEPYFFPPQTSPYEPVRRLFSAVEATLGRHGADMRWARRLPGLIAQLLRSTPVVEAAPGPFGGPRGDLTHELSRLNVLQVGPMLVANSLITESDVSDVLALLDDTSFLDMMSVNLSVWAAKPAAE